MLQSHALPPVSESCYEGMLPLNPWLYMQMKVLQGSSFNVSVWMTDNVLLSAATPHKLLEAAHCNFSSLGHACYDPYPLRMQLSFR